jgi:hypothetical protein
VLRTEHATLDSASRRILCCINTRFTVWACFITRKAGRGIASGSTCPPCAPAGRWRPGKCVITHQRGIELMKASLVLQGWLKMGKVTSLAGQCTSPSMPGSSPSQASTGQSLNIHKFGQSVTIRPSLATGTTMYQTEVTVDQEQVALQQGTWLVAKNKCVRHWDRTGTTES